MKDPSPGSRADRGAPEELDDFARGLLVAARADAMPAASKRALLAAAATGALASSTSRSPSSSSAGPRAGGEAARSLRPWLASGLAVGVAATFAFVVPSTRRAPAGDTPAASPRVLGVSSETRASDVASSPSPARPPGSAPEPPVIEPTAGRTPPPHAPRTAPDARARVTGTARTPPAVSATSSASPREAPDGAEGVAEEAALVDRAREALARRDATEALAFLDEHASRHRNALLAEEAGALRIEALAMSGATERARSLGRAWLAEHPLSAHAPRVRRALARAGESP
jgi:hypothetical protein